MYFLTIMIKQRETQVQETGDQTLGSKENSQEDDKEVCHGKSGSGLGRSGVLWKKMPLMTRLVGVY